jgi:hypothetical protein
VSDALEQHLGIGGTPEPHPRRPQTVGELPVVVDLSVVGEHPPAVLRRHRLRTCS